jgi:hypothetical protein
VSFTLVTLTGNYGSAATGTLTFTLTETMADADSVLVPQPITASLAAGAFSQVLQSNVDPATSPQGVMWGVTEQVTGAQPRDYFIEVPTQLTETAGATTVGSPYVQLSSVTGALWMTGLPITGPGIPANTTVALVLQQTNQLQLSTNTTATGKGLSLVIGTTTIDISALMPTTMGWQ